MPTLALPWETKCVRYLGIRVTHDTKEFEESNIGRVMGGLKRNIHFGIHSGCH